MKKCKTCDIIFSPNSNFQLYCGSLKMKTGCSYDNDRKYRNKYCRSKQAKKYNNKYHITYKPDSFKVKSRNKIRYEVRAKRILKPIICELCNEVKSLQAHHKDYNKPLDVNWLCKQCHILADKVVGGDWKEIKKLSPTPLA